MTELTKMKRKIGMKRNMEELKKRSVSEKLPEFEKMRTGTEIYVLDGEKKIRVYNDYSMYPESTAKSWKVQIYNIKNGTFYDRAAINHGRYPTRERALAEVDRFKNRAEKLIFYVFPVNFDFDKEKFLWSEAEQKFFDYETPVYATKEEQLEEAEKRIYALTGKRGSDIENLIENNGNNLAVMNAILKFINAQQSSSHKGLPFCIINSMPTSISILYVGADKSFWESERCGINSKKKSGYVSAFVYNPSCPMYSEYGDIWYKSIGGTLYRTA
jgi:hypothetical protein